MTAETDAAGMSDAITEIAEHEGVDADVTAKATEVSAALDAVGLPSPKVLCHGPKSLVFVWGSATLFYLTITADSIAALISTPEKIIAREAARRLQGEATESRQGSGLVSRVSAVSDDGMALNNQSREAQIPAGTSRPAAEVRERVAFDMLAHLTRQREWSGKTFGPGARTAGVIDHIRKELEEIEADPADVKEWIDVVILALDGAWRAGYQPQQIIDALVAKQTKNETRIWPDWRTMPQDKAIEHDRGSGALLAQPDARNDVPREPTTAMNEAGGVIIVREFNESDWEEAKDMAEGLNPNQIWIAMWDASQQRPERE